MVRSKQSKMQCSVSLQCEGIHFVTYAEGSWMRSVFKALRNPVLLEAWCSWLLEVNMCRLLFDGGVRNSVGRFH